MALWQHSYMTLGAANLSIINYEPAGYFFQLTDYCIC